MIGCLKAVIALTLLLVAGAIGFGVWWNQSGDEVISKSREAREEGLAYGASRTPDECLVTAMSRLEAERGILAEVRHGLFLHGCLEGSPTGYSVCTGLPDSGEILDSALWSVTACQVLGHPGDQGCARLVRRVQEFCDAPDPG